MVEKLSIKLDGRELNHTNTSKDKKKEKTLHHKRLLVMQKAIKLIRHMSQTLRASTQA